MQLSLSDGTGREHKQSKGSGVKIWHNKGTSKPSARRVFHWGGEGVSGGRDESDKGNPQRKREERGTAKKGAQ